VLEDGSALSDDPMQRLPCALRGPAPVVVPDGRPAVPSAFCRRCRESEGQWRRISTLLDEKGPFIDAVTRTTMRALDLASLQELTPASILSGPFSSRRSCQTITMQNWNHPWAPQPRACLPSCSSRAL
jgi:hypothetical protein